jgi:hypothetical protein
VDLSQFKLRVGVGVAAVFAVVAVLIIFLSGWKGELQPGTSRLTMRYNLPMRFMGYVMLILGVVFPIGLVVLVIVKPPPDNGSLIAVGCMGLGVALAGLYTWREMRYGYAVADDKGIEKVSPWVGRKVVAWNDVEYIRVYPNGLVKIRGKNRVQLNFPVYWAGLHQLLKACEENIGDKIERRRM